MIKQDPANRTFVRVLLIIFVTLSCFSEPFYVEATTLDKITTWEGPVYKYSLYQTPTRLFYLRGNWQGCYQSPTPNNCGCSLTTGCVKGLTNCASYPSTLRTGFVVPKNNNGSNGTPRSPGDRIWTLTFSTGLPTSPNYFHQYEFTFLPQPAEVQPNITVPWTKTSGQISPQPVLLLPGSPKLEGYKSPKLGTVTYNEKTYEYKNTTGKCGTDTFYFDIFYNDNTVTNLPTCTADNYETCLAQYKDPSFNVIKSQTSLVNVTVGKAPTANFNITTTSGISPLSVNITNLSQGDLIEWDFIYGDGTSKNYYNTPPPQTVSHTYTYKDVAGTNYTKYVFQLKVKNCAGLTNTKQINIYVYKPGYTGAMIEDQVATDSLSANFMAFPPNNGTSPFSVFFSNMSTGDLADYTWDFGDGTSSNEVNPMHTYNDSGIYTVKLTANGINNDSSVLEKSNYIAVDDPPMPPLVDVKANGSDGPLTLRNGILLSTVRLRLNLNANGFADQHGDYWVLVQDPAGNWQSYVSQSQSWVAGIVPFTQEPLEDMQQFILGPDMSMAGEYAFYFGVDSNMNGVREVLWQDVVRVTVP